jgi:glutathione S-transferase
MRNDRPVACAGTSDDRRRTARTAALPHLALQREGALALEDWFDEAVAPALRRLFWSAYVGDAALCARMATDGFGTATRVAWRATWPLMRPLFSRNMGLDAAALAAARRDLAGFFDRLEREIGPSGYLAGDTFGVADLTAAAAMTAIIRPREFPYPIPEPWPTALVELRGSIADRTGFRWVIDTYARHRGVSAEAPT